nr:MAG TPA: hypothetical protein [Caudoviricetes sp.]
MGFSLSSYPVGFLTPPFGGCPTPGGVSLVFTLADSVLRVNPAIMQFHFG